MRAGNCGLQQALTSDASAIVKQAVVLAKRRGHAQVTPLHVANTMLSAQDGLFRAACLESHSHRLRCKALELCFNVALNRLPACSSSSPILGPQYTHHQQQYPSISNALVAAFKRAQAHQRRGSIENQQQPTLAVKIELEQLIISILDDPSVSRVMREAGFSSTQVKINVEKAVSLQLCSQNNHDSTDDDINPSNKSKELDRSTHDERIHLIASSEASDGSDQDQPVRKEDVNVLIESLLMRGKRNRIVIVGECISNLGNTVRALMNRVDKGEVPEELKQAKFVSIPPLYSFCNLHREVVGQKMGELACLVKSLLPKGVVLYLGDLRWISDYRVKSEQERGYYCSVEHMIMEIGRFVWGIGEMRKFWLVGIATFQTYMRCRSGYNSLEALWGLHPVTIPANSLGLSLVSAESDEPVEAARVENSGEIPLTCCDDCMRMFEEEVRNLKGRAIIDTNEPTLSILPCWLRDESRIRRPSYNDQSSSIRELSMKWNTYCRNSSHKKPSSPSSEGTLKSATSSDVIMDIEQVKNFREFNAENLNLLCDKLATKVVPCNKNIIPEIATAILQCRAGMVQRKNNLTKEDTWLLFLGHDTRAKEKTSRELAKVVFGSYSSFVSLSTFVYSSSSARTYSLLNESRNKRCREGESSMSYMDRFVQAMASNPHRVIFVEDFEDADYFSKMGIKRAIERGRISSACGDEEVSLRDAIVVLCCEGTRSSRSPPLRGKMGNTGVCEREDEQEGMKSNSVWLDLNVPFTEKDCNNEDDQCVDELGILDCVDRKVVFEIKEGLVRI